MSGFTPGPWGWREHNGMRRLAPGVLIIDNDGGGPWGDEIDRANAALIAAAPELYEALQIALAQLETVDVDELWGDGGDAFSDAMESARAALAKAVPPGTGDNND